MSSSEGGVKGVGGPDRVAVSPAPPVTVQTSQVIARSPDVSNRPVVTNRLAPDHPSSVASATSGVDLSSVPAVRRASRGVPQLKLDPDLATRCCSSPSCAKAKGICWRSSPTTLLACHSISSPTRFPQPPRQRSPRSS